MSLQYCDLANSFDRCHAGNRRLERIWLVARRTLPVMLPRLMKAAIFWLEEGLPIQELTIVMVEDVQLKPRQQPSACWRVAEEIFQLLEIMLQCYTRAKIIFSG